MANTRWKDKLDIGTLTATNRIPVTDDIGVSNIDKYFTPAEIYTYVMGGVSTAERDILDGATVSTAELNILDGVTANKDELNILDGVTANKDELNILDGVTANKDELNILDGVKATTSGLNILDAGADVAMLTTGANLILRINGVNQVIIQDGKINPITDTDIDLGDATHKFKSAYIGGTTLLSDILALDGAVQRITTLSTLINATSAKATIATGSGTLGITISDGNYDGQLKYIYLIRDGGGDATLTGANFAGTSLAFTVVGSGATLMWDDGESKWFCVGQNECRFTL